MAWDRLLGGITLPTSKIILTTLLLYTVPSLIFEIVLLFSFPEYKASYVVYFAWKQDVYLSQHTLFFTKFSLIFLLNSDRHVHTAMRLTYGCHY